MLTSWTDWFSVFGIERSCLVMGWLIDCQIMSEWSEQLRWLRGKYVLVNTVPSCPVSSAESVTAQWQCWKCNPKMTAVFHYSNRSISSCRANYSISTEHKVTKEKPYGYKTNQNYFCKDFVTLKLFFICGFDSSSWFHSRMHALKIIKAKVQKWRKGKKKEIDMFCLECNMLCHIEWPITLM